MGAAGQQRAIPIVVFAIDPRAPMFQEHTSTVAVTPGGAAIRLRHAVEPGATLFIFNRDAGTEAEFVVEGTSATGEVRVAVRKRDHQVDIWGLAVESDSRTGTEAPMPSAALEAVPADESTALGSAGMAEAISSVDQAVSGAGQSRELAAAARAQAQSLKTDVGALADEASAAGDEVAELGRRAAELRSESDAALRWIEELRAARRRAGQRLADARGQLEAAEKAVAETRVSIALSLRMLSEMHPQLERALSSARQVVESLTSRAAVLEESKEASSDSVQLPARTAAPRAEEAASGAATLDTVQTAPRVASPPEKESDIIAATPAAAAPPAVQESAPAQMAEDARAADAAVAPEKPAGPITPPAAEPPSAPAASPASAVPVPAAPSVADPRFLTGPLTRSDRRYSRRVQVKTRARIRRLNWIEVVVPVDISRTGFAFRSAAAYELNEPVSVAMHYREDDMGLIEVGGHVARIVPDERGGPPRYGIRFAT